MSENIFEPLAGSLVYCSKTIWKCAKKILGLNMYDFRKLFEEIGLCNKSKEYPKLFDISEEEYFKKFTFKCPVGITLENFKKNEEKLAHFLGVNKDVLRIENNNYKIDIKIMIKRPNASYDPDSMKRKDFKIPLGFNLNSNKLVYWDLINPSDTHCYIAGSSGGGKSVTLRLILSHLINSKGKRDIEFSIVNTKRVDLKDFQYAKHTKKYMTGTDGVEDFLKDDVEEMERRYKLIEREDCDDLTEFRNKCYKIPYRIVVVEEISSYKGNKDYQRHMELLASQGRGAGIILLLVTQLPSHEIMPNTIKCNINVTIGLKTKDAIRSEIIAGPDSGLEKLKGNGHSKLFTSKHDGTEYQGMYISKDMMKDIIAKNKKEQK